MRTSIHVTELYQQLIERCLYADEKELVFNFLQKHNLQCFIDGSIIEIETIIHHAKESSQIKVDRIKTIAYTFLKRFNEKLLMIEDGHNKLILKNLLTKLTKGITQEILQQAPSHAADIRLAITQGFEQAVVVEGYNLQDFELYFQLDYKDISNAAITLTSTPEPNEYLFWDNKRADVNKLAKALKDDYFCIKSKEEFISFFNDEKKNEIIRWDSAKLDFLIWLIHRLYEEKYIELRGGKGLWKLLLWRFRDFDKNPLDFDPPKRLHKIKSAKTLKPRLAKDASDILEYIRIK